MSHVPALLALMVASAAAAAPLKSREGISAPLPADASACYDKPQVTDTQKAGYKLAFVRSTMRWKENRVCTDDSAGEHLTVYEEVDGSYRTLKSAGFGDGTTNPILFTAFMASDSTQSPQALLVIELHYSGTGTRAQAPQHRGAGSGRYSRMGLSWWLR